MRFVARHPFAWRWALGSFLLFAVTLMWSIASPVPSGPDEQAQLIKSAAVAHGTVVGTPHPTRHAAGTVTVRVPALIHSASARADCDYDIFRPAHCSAQLDTSGRMVTVTTYEGRYPPLYYFLTGLPTLVGHSAWVLHAMRAISALLVSLLFGMAFACAATWGRSNLLLISMAVTLTPAALYIGSVVNPSAMEVAGGVLLWAALTVLFLYQAEDPPWTLIAAAIVGAVALCASRPLSTGFFALIVATLVALRPATARALFALRRIKVALVASFGFAFISGLFVLYAKSYEVEQFPIKPRPTLDYVIAVVGHGNKVLRQVIGSFGAPNFVVPTPVLVVWFVAGFGLIFLGLMLARRRDALVLLAVFAVFGFVLPFAIAYSHVRSDGIIWQGRYSLPLIAGLPILGGVLLSERYPRGVAASRRRVGVFVLLGLVFGWVTGFYWVLRRYTVGLSYNTTNAFRHDPGYWSPVIPAIAVFVILLLATLAFAVWVYRESDLAGRRALEEHLPAAQSTPAVPPLASSRVSRTAASSAQPL